MLTVLALYAALGAVAGLLAGLFGVGGGIVVVPMLVFTLGYQDIAPDMIMPLSVATSMATIVFTSLSSSLAHNRSGGVDWRIVGAMTPGVLLGPVAGTLLASHMPADALKFIFVIFLAYVAFQMLLGRKPKPSRHLPGKMGLSGAGFLLAAFSSMVGIGGGTLTMPFLLWCNVPIHTAVGTAAAIGFPIAMVGTLGYLFNGLGHAALPPHTLGFIYLPALIGIAVVSMICAPLGARLSHRLPVPRLKMGFAVLLLAVDLKMLLSLF